MTIFRFLSESVILSESVKLLWHASTSTPLDVSLLIYVRKLFFIYSSITSVINLLKLRDSLNHTGKIENLSKAVFKLCTTVTPLKRNIIRDLELSIY